MERSGARPRPNGFGRPKFFWQKAILDLVSLTGRRARRREPSRHARVHIDTVEYLYRGAIVFALDSLDTTTTVEDLWSKAGRYVLPDCVLSERPADMPRCAIESALFDTNLVWKGAGLEFDKFYEQ